jgi:hypothetical protein
MLFFLGLSTTSTFSQGLEGTCWKNAFGSNARITSHNLTTGEFRGTYGSTTGSAGYYTIIGQTPKNPDLNDSFPLTFTIGWGKINGIPDDPSQYWSSSMSGYYEKNNSGEETLNLLNIISAPGPFEDVKILKPGNLPQTQSFTLVPTEDCNALNIPPPSIPDGDGSATDQEYAHHLLGNWDFLANYGTGAVTKIIVENLVPRGESFSALRYYEVTGSLYLKDTTLPVPFTGIVGPHISSENNSFGFAMSIVGKHQDSSGKHINISLSGFSSGDATNTIEMFLLNSYKRNPAIPRIDANKISSGELFQKN